MHSFIFLGYSFFSFLVWELLVGFQDVAFLPSRTGFSTTCLKHCGRGEIFLTTTCLTTVVGGRPPDHHIS